MTSKCFYRATLGISTEEYFSVCFQSTYMYFCQNLQKKTFSPFHSDVKYLYKTEFVNFKVDLGSIIDAMKYKSVLFFHLTVRKWKSGMSFCVINIHDHRAKKNAFADGLSRNTLSLFAW